MKKEVVILALIYLTFSLVEGDASRIERDKQPIEQFSKINTSTKLPFIIRLFGKKPFKLIKKSISLVLEGIKNEDKLSFDEKHRRLFSRIVTVAASSVNLKNASYEENITETCVPSLTPWSQKPYSKRDALLLHRFKYTTRYIPPRRIRKYYTPNGSPMKQEVFSQRSNNNTYKFSEAENLMQEMTTSTYKPNFSDDIRIFTTAVNEPRETNEPSNFNENPNMVQLDYNYNTGKRQRRCSVHDSSNLDEGYTYLLRRKRPEVTFNPYIYLTKLSRKPIYSKDHVRRQSLSRYYSFHRVHQSMFTLPTTTSTPRDVTRMNRIITKSAQPSEVKIIPKIPSRMMITSRTTTPPWTTTTRKANINEFVTTHTMIESINEKKTSQNESTPPTYYWINNWNKGYLSYYMSSIQHTFRTYQSPDRGKHRFSQNKTTRAMYYLPQYWNTAYHSYYTNFDPPDESLRDFIKRLGYFPDTTTRGRRIRVMPKRFTPQGFIDIFSLESFLHNDVPRIVDHNETYPPPHEKYSSSGSAEDISYWFYFNNSATANIQQVIVPATYFKQKITMKPIPSPFFKKYIITRYYPPSVEEFSEYTKKVEPTTKKYERTQSSAKYERTQSSTNYERTQPSTKYERTQSSTKYERTQSTRKYIRYSISHPFVIRSYTSRLLTTTRAPLIETPIPTLPTIKETTIHKIDPYGLLSKILQYNMQIKRPLSRNGTVEVHPSRIHPVNQLPRFLQLPFTLSPKLLVYTADRGRQLFTLLGKYRIHENNKTLECVRNPTEFLNPFKAVAPPPGNGFYRVIQRHRIRDNDTIEKKPAESNFDNHIEGKHPRQKPDSNDRTLAVEIRFYPIQTTSKIKTWKEYLESQKHNSSFANLPPRNNNNNLK